jgi:Protein of unknown function (DUF1552)
MSRSQSRRTILKALGLGAGFLPLLQAERAPAAAGNGFPKRLVTITWTDGIVPPNFFPAGPAGPLPAALPPILQPLQQWSSQLLVMRSASGQTSPIDLTCMLDNNGRYGGHSAYGSLLTGFNTGGGPSIDQIIADDLTKNQNLSGKQLNVGCRPYGSSTSYRAAGQKNNAQTDPYKLFSSLFAGQSMPASQVNALLLRRKSVLDFVGSQLTRFASNLGTDDKIKVQNHLDSVRDLETQLQATTSGAVCTPPSVTPAGLDFNNVNNYPQHVGFMADIVAAAISCDKARAITMDLIDDGGGNSLTFPWLGIASPDYHAVAHQGSAGYTNKTKIDTWYYQQAVAGLVSKLAATPEGAGSALDNTVILVTNDMNEGSNHGTFSIPYLIIGSCSGFFKTGRTVTFDKPVANNQLLTTLCHAMGVNLASVGDPKYGGDLDSVLQS